MKSNFYFGLGNLAELLSWFSVLGFYCNNTIPVIQNFEENYGSHLDGLSYSEKLWLAMVLVEDATYEAGDDYVHEVRDKTIRSEIGQLRQKFLVGIDAAEKIKLAVAILENTNVPQENLDFSNYYLEFKGND